MFPLDTFDHPLTGRYASPEMQRLFSTGHRYTTWRRMWLALAEAECELGLESRPRPSSRCAPTWN